MQVFDGHLRTALSKVCNIALDDEQWLQASLPVSGRVGLTIRRAISLALSAFLASAAGTENLQACILINCTVTLSEPLFVSASQQWMAITNLPCPSDHRQRSWDGPIVELEFQSLFTRQNQAFHRARLLAITADHSSDWLHALPITACGQRFEDEAVRVAVGLRLGCGLCQPHRCPCGTEVDPRGVHGLSCRRSACRTARHHYLNDLIYRALSRAENPATKEPHGLLRADGKRPNGLMLIPWREGRSITWDVTICDTVADSYLADSSAAAGALAEAAALRKTAKYADVMQNHLFCPVAVETFGPIFCSEGHIFITEIGRRISTITSDPRKTAFLYQRISMAVQRFNAVCIAGTFLEDQFDLPSLT